MFSRDRISFLHDKPNRLENADYDGKRDIIFIRAPCK